MASITVRNLDEAVKASLRLQAAQHGWSMEQEVRHILQQAVATQPAESMDFAERINRRFHGSPRKACPFPHGRSAGSRRRWRPDVSGLPA